METISYHPVGVVHSSFKEPEGTPIQPKAARGVEGVVELRPKFTAGLKDLDGFSHIILVYHMHLSESYRLEVKPFLDNKLRGLFSTRAPKRPNPIGISVVKLQRIDGNTLHVTDLDILDGTPLLDIKPYVPPFDEPEEIRIGWLEGKVHRVTDKRADDRFDF